VKLLSDRATTASSSIASAAMSGKISVSDIGLLPVTAIVGIAFPPASFGLTVLSIGLGAIDQYDNIAELNLETSAYKGSAEVLKGALRKLAAKSVENRLQGLNHVKNDIDTACK